MLIERSAPAATDPVDTAALFAFVRVEDQQLQAEASRIALAAAAELEKYAQLALFDQTIRVTLDCWPRSAVFALPVAPLNDALSVTITVAGQPFDAFAITVGLRPAVRCTGDKPSGEVVITYAAGFGVAPADLPHDLRLAIMDQVAIAFDLRGTADGKTNGMGAQAARIAARYRRVAVG